MLCVAILAVGTVRMLQSLQALLSIGYDENVCASATSFAWVMARWFSFVFLFDKLTYERVSIPQLGVLCKIEALFGFPALEPRPTWVNNRMRMVFGKVDPFLATCGA